MLWTPEWLRLLKKGGLIIFGGRKLQHRAILAFEDTGFIYKDMLSWNRGKATYKAQRITEVFNRRNDLDNSKKWEGWRLGNLKPTFEPILWFIKPYRQGTTIVDNLISNQLDAFNESALRKYTNRDKKNFLKNKACIFLLFLIILDKDINFEDFNNRLS
jgi:site-specific DNA-methyltransferase (adenine-specific)